MEMHQVRYFLAVADTLNFTRAAEQCHVSQPALTRAIQQLEEEFGGLLLRRERKLTHLTDFGRLIEPHYASFSPTQRPLIRPPSGSSTFKKLRFGSALCVPWGRLGSWGF